MKQNTVVRNLGVALTVVLIACTSQSLAEPSGQDKSASDMKAEVAALQVKIDEAEAKQGTISSKFAGFGKELGVAFNGFVEAMDGGMKVTTTRVNEFAQTDVGKFAMFCIGWKIFAADAARIVRSFIHFWLGFVFMGIVLYILKRMVEVFLCGRMIVVKREGPWYNRNITKERSESLVKSIKSADSDQQTLIYWALALHVVAFIVGGVAMVISFTSL